MMRLQQAGSGLASDILLTIIVKDEATAQPIFQLLWASIHGFERRFSRFLSDSELSHVNEEAGSEINITPAFHDFLVVSQQYSEQTDDIYNPLVLPALQQAGYVGSWPAVTVIKSDLDYRQRRPTTQSEAIILTQTTVRLPADSAFDSGGIGKGYLLDQLADLLDTKHVKHYWLSLGGDIICAGFNSEDQPWKVGIADAEANDKIVRTITNSTGERLAIATSGTTKRRGIDWHHIIDPHTGKPAVTEVLTATVISASGVSADIYAKYLVILGVEAAQKAINQQHITGALLQIRHTRNMQTKAYGTLA